MGTGVGGAGLWSSLMLRRCTPEGPGNRPPLPSRHTASPVTRYSSHEHPRQHPGITQCNLTVTTSRLTSKAPLTPALGNASGQASPAAANLPRATSATASPRVRATLLVLSIIVEIPLFVEALHCVERKHSPHVRNNHSMRMYHGNRPGRKREMSRISGKDTPTRLPDAPLREKALACQQEPGPGGRRR
jgi:hypothetical protein